MEEKSSESDPRGLIYEAYRIEGVTQEECRAIFFDWALSLPADLEQSVHVRKLHDTYATRFPEHPMTAVLEEGLTTLSRPQRRGGWRSRPRN